MSMPDLFDHVVTMKRKVETPDGQGSVNTSLTPIIVDMPCHIWPLSGREQDDYLKKEVIADYGLMALPQEVDLVEKDVADWDGFIYDVTFVHLPIAKQKYLKLALQKRK